MAARKASPAKKATRTTRKATKRTTGRSQAKLAATKRAAQKEVRAKLAAPVSAASPRTAAGNLRTYRARQSVVGPNGRVRAGELLQLDPSSGLAKSPFVSLVGDAAPPDEVAAALDDAG